MSKQTKLGSFKETCVQVGIGFGLSLILQIILSHVYDFNASVSTNIQVTIWFTLLSLARGYVVRRLAEINAWGRFKAYVKGLFNDKAKV